MHEVKSIKKWFFVGVVGLIAIGFFVSVSYFKKEETGIDFVVVERSELIQEVNATGSIKPADEVTLGFEIGGRVSVINVNVGDRVTAGQVIVRLRNSDLQAQLLQVQANLAEEEARLVKLEVGTRIEEINIQKVKVENAESALVDARKDVVNKLRDAYSKSDDAIRSKVDQLFSNPRSTNPELNMIISNNQLKTNVESVRFTMEQTLMSWESNLLELTFESEFPSFFSITDNNLYQVRDFLDDIALATNSLTANASISQTTIDGYRADIWTGRTNVNTAIVNITASQEKLRGAQSVLTLTQNELALKKAGATTEEIAVQEARVRGAQAGVQNAEAKLAKTTLYSSITGVVTKVDVKVGEIISMNDMLVSVISADDFEIEANIAEADIAKLSIGDNAKVTLDAYGGDVVFEAVIINIDPAETVIEGVPTYKTTFRLIPDDRNIKSGMTANIDILTNKKTNIISIPARAVKIIDGDKIVKVLNSDGVVSEKKVETGLRGSDGRIEILSGIEDGEKVIIFMP